MNKNGDICLALKNFDSKLLYMVGKLHNNGNLVWGDPLQLNVECFGTPLVTITDDGIAMLAYEGKYEHKYRLGELSHNNTINWGPECDYSWRCGTLKSAAIFQHENREFVVLFTAERDFETFAPGTISYEIGLLKDKEIIWQKIILLGTIFHIRVILQRSASLTTKFSWPLLKIIYVKLLCSIVQLAK
ncbi:MAG: hypothetical protein HWD59_04115 [Coxiellaceae bacterium]|nr:MAG: hypothetical protein HWD59_04115 [Coxiellaceae bacterium]